MAFAGLPAFLETDEASERRNILGAGGIEKDADAARVERQSVRGDIGGSCRKLRDSSHPRRTLGEEREAQVPGKGDNKKKSGKGRTCKPAGKRPIFLYLGVLDRPDSDSQG